jgi:HSP20 family protein
LTPWRAQRPTAPAAFGDPFRSFQREMDRLFDDFSHSFGMPSLRETFGDDRFLMPRLDVDETDKAYEISVELPGIDEKDLEVTVADGVLTIRGEKKAESENKDKGHLHVERSFGAFQRTLSLPADADAEKIDAAFKNGVLKLTIGKAAESAPAAKKIAIKSK